MSYAGRRREDDENLIVDDVAPTLRANGGKDSKGQAGNRTDQHPIIAYEVWPESSTKTGPGQWNARETDEASSLNAAAHPGKRSEQGTLTHSLPGSVGFDASEDGTGRGTPITPENTGLVRRLTPTECERLQGLPDGWTVPWGPSLARVLSWYELSEYDRRMLAAVRQPNDPLPDGPRYAACGDAVTVPVAQWIGERLLEFG